MMTRGLRLYIGGRDGLGIGVLLRCCRERWSRMFQSRVRSFGLTKRNAARMC